MVISAEKRVPAGGPLTRGGSPEEVSSRSQLSAPGRRGHRASRNGRQDTDPPLLVLLAVHHDHLALVEGQLVRVVGHAVVDGFHSLGPLLLRDETHKLGSVGFAEKTSDGRQAKSCFGPRECCSLSSPFLELVSVVRQWSSMRSFLILVYEV